MNEVYARAFGSTTPARAFGSTTPARATVEVAALPLGARVEIEAVAVLPG
jgi:2-iminobutanoate/2-iminopropanoate deaminase